ncbi:peptide chain release factor N(5)-glutamine methyltransferase [Pseudodesulfovibrio tunisiensis]|uniref:peptide chain release factor N(5)-glutamine methyltransferase n=1 Tax=Pseudodesulfovibrio tunisiensis TaxID=463192 RepID=UPI001FB4CBC9|nr:peptide chain release factor N(5)-glutamine methyltransferase [Pseudodesulfovibrio tunisiensis]
MAFSIRELLARCEADLLRKGVDSPRLSAELLLAEALDCTRLRLVMDHDRVVPSEQQQAFEALWQRRAVGEPVAYILGTREFYGLDFDVNSDTLIPRPETEHIIEAVEAAFPHDASFRFVDFGTGSGAIAVTLATLFPRARGVAVDMSSGALCTARCNAEHHNVTGRLAFVRADFTRPLFSDGIFDLVVSNPPYVTESEYAEASREVTGFEPATALLGGEDGLDLVRDLVPLVGDVLKPGGLFLMEIGYRQGDGVKKILSGQDQQFRCVEVLPDLAGLDRVARARKL